jgi:hypothetical protein
LEDGARAHRARRSFARTLVKVRQPRLWLALRRRIADDAMSG